MKALYSALLLALAMSGSAGAGELKVLFEVPWDPAPRAAMAARLASVDVFSPQWIAITDTAGTIARSPDAAAQAALKRTPRIKVMPIVGNAHDGVWDAAAATAAINDPAVQGKVLDQLATLARRERYAGYVFDFEALTAEAAAAYPAFLAAARARMARARLSVWVTAPLSTDPLVLAALARSSDSVVLMAYDECWAASTPGPVAGQDWFELMLQDRLPAAGGRRAIVALGAYAYDWPAGGAASVLSVTDARALAKVHGSEIRRDLATANLTFTYVDEQARSHEVWMTDLVTLNYEREAVTAAGARGWALWRLGLEDPAIWTGAPAAAAAPYSPSPGPLRLPRCFLLPAPPGH